MWSMAWRNLLRHWRRSAITLSAVAFGLSALLFLWGFNDGAHNNMMRNLQDVIGSVQIHPKHGFKRPKLTRDLPEMASLQRLLSMMDGVRYTPRLRTFALAAGRTNSEGTVMLGVDPIRERATTRIADRIGKGRFLRERDRNACVLGETMARNLEVGLGEEIVLLTQDRFGALAAEKFTVVGIIASGEMGLDRGLVIVPLPFMQAMLSMQGKVSYLVLRLEETRLEGVAAKLRDELDPDRYDVLRWYDMYPVMKQWILVENAFYYIFLAIVLLIVVAGVMNTVLMSMIDRVHEFGVMMALGCSRLRLALMLLLESGMLGIIGVAFGTSMGLAVVAWFHRHGIDLSTQISTVRRFYVDPVIHPEINTDHLILTAVAVIAGCLIAALAPVLRVARLEPVEALRHA